LSQPVASIIIPIYNEAASLPATLAALQSYRQRGCEVIVVDGGSRDNSCAIAASQVDCVLHSGKGRAAQMNAGARKASGNLLVFLHADTLLPQAEVVINQWLQADVRWGFFTLALSGRSLAFRIVERSINWRSAATHVATGDQALFFNRAFFFERGGFAAMPLMEDVELTGHSRRFAKPLIISGVSVVTSSRRWEQRGTLATILLMWRLRALYWLGVDGRELVRRYE